jgi:DNA-binding MarR family transcriptional regulator
MVTRASVPGDLRVTQVALTPIARQLVQRVLTGHAGQIDAVLGPLSSEDHQSLHGLLTKLNAHLEKMAERAVI